MIVAQKFGQQQVNLEILELQTLALLPERSVGTDGLEIGVAWTPTVGTTDAVVEAAWIDLSPVSANDPGDSVAASMTPQGNGFNIQLAGPARPIRSIRLNGLKAAGVDRELRSQADVTNLAADLPGPTWRLCVSVDQGAGFGLVQYALPYIGQTGQRPALLFGARFESRVLYLPDVTATAVRVSLMRGDLPEDFAEQGASLSSASVRVAPGPVDLEVSDSSGPLWSMPGAFAERARIDLKNSVGRGLGEAPTAAVARISLKGKTAGRLHASAIGVQGHLLRKFPYKVQASFEGNRQALGLGKLDPRPPAAVQVDISIVHEGLRLHPLSRAVPQASGGLSGRVVGTAPLVRQLPPQALRGDILLRIGVAGFAAEGTLSLRLLEGAGEKAGAPIPGGFAEAEIQPTEPGGAPRLTWLHLAKPFAVDRRFSIELSAASRFLWVENDGQPVLQFAVATAPGGQIQIAGKPFEITAERTDLTGQTLPTAPFAGGPVDVLTDQFCRLTLSNLRLRYAP